MMCIKKQVKSGFRLLLVGLVGCCALFVVASPVHAENPVICPQFYLGEESDPTVYIYWAEYHNDEGAGQGQCGHESSDLFYYGTLLDDNFLPKTCNSQGNFACLPAFGGGSTLEPTAEATGVKGLPADPKSKPKLADHASFTKSKYVSDEGTFIQFEHPKSKEKIVAKIFVIGTSRARQGKGASENVFRSVGYGRQVTATNDLTPEVSDITDISTAEFKQIRTIKLKYHGESFRILIK